MSDDEENIRFDLDDNLSALSDTASLSGSETWDMLSQTKTNWSVNHNLFESDDEIGISESNVSTSNSSTNHKASDILLVSQLHTDTNLRRSPRSTKRKTWSDCDSNCSSDSENQTNLPSQNMVIHHVINHAVNANHRHHAHHTEEMKTQSIDLFEKGWTVQEIHKATNISTSTIHYWNRTQRKKGLLVRKTPHSIRYYRKK